MAKANPIKDEQILTLARRIMPTPGYWQSAHQARLIWLLFRSLGFCNQLEGESEAEHKIRLAAAGKAWDAFWSNGSLAFSSNTARRLADAGIAKEPGKEASLAEYE